MPEAEQGLGSVGVVIVFLLPLRLRLRPLRQTYLLPLLQAFRAPALGSVDMVHSLSASNSSFFLRHLVLILHIFKCYVPLREAQLPSVRRNKARAKIPYSAFLSIDSCLASTMLSRAVTIGSSLHMSPFPLWLRGS